MSGTSFVWGLLVLLRLVVMAIMTMAQPAKEERETVRLLQERRGGLGWFRHPQTYQSDDEIPVLLHSLTSTQVLIPKDPCQELPGLCENNITSTTSPRLHYHPETLDLFQGDAVFASPIRTVRVLRDEYCRQLSWTPPLTETQVQAWKRMIRQDYHLNWHLDGIPAAYKSETESTITTRYWQGSALGFMDHYDRSANDGDGNFYVNNHRNLEIMYSRVGGSGDNDDVGYRIVRFTIQPFSIRHEIMTTDQKHQELPFPLKGPIRSCDPSQRSPVHTDFEMTHYQKIGYGHEQRPMLSLEVGSGILWTYDVIWIESHHLKWSDRWDIYLSMDSAVPARVHWLSIINSSVVIIICFAIVIVIWRRNISGYRHVSTQDDTLTTTTPPPPPWHAIKHHVFRPPPYPSVLAVCCGTGAHLLATTVLLILSGFIGLADQSRTGSLMLTGLIWYALTGWVNGLCTVYYAKSFGGKAVYKTAAVSAMAFPMIALVVAVMSQRIYQRHSSTAASGQLLFIPICLWFIVLLPSHALGTIIAARRIAPCRFPVPTAPDTQVRPIPPRTVSTWFFSVLYLLAVAQYPFASLFVEYYYILASTWLGYYYNAFFFAGIVFLVAVLTQAVTAVLFVYYFCFRKENYCWWWKAFWLGAWTGIASFYYSTKYAAQFDSHGSHAPESEMFASSLLYYGFMIVVCLAIGLAMGVVGLVASLSFSCWLYSVFDEEGTPEDGAVELTLSA